MRAGRFPSSASPRCSKDSHVFQLRTRRRRTGFFRHGHCHELIFAVFYFLLIRPQQQQMKKHRAKVAAVKKGDQVVTGGGLVGRVVRVDDAYVDVELGQGIKVKAVKATLSDVVDPMTAKPAND